MRARFVAFPEATSRAQPGTGWAFALDPGGGFRSLAFLALMGRKVVSLANPERTDSPARKEKEQLAEGQRRRGKGKD